jgi:hypothetical protein
MDKLINCKRCGQKSMSIDDSLLCGGCRQENPYLMGAPEASSEPDTVESLHEAACKLTEMLDDAENKLHQKEAQLTAARERIAELERALEPFSREARSWNELGDGSDIPMICGPGNPDELSDAVFNLGDLRRAAALLEKKR